jgi:DNA-binding GntR family transcriptional regulator
MHDARQSACAVIERRIVRGELESGLRLDEHSLAGELHVDAGVVREALACLERDNLTRAEADGGFSVAPLDESELRELYPVALLLEGLAVRTAPGFPPEQLERLREINGRLGSCANDPMTAATCDWEFHDELVRHCGNEQLLDTLRPLKRQLLRYEFAYMEDAATVERSAGQHAAITDALAAGDRERAATLVESNFRDALPDLLARMGAGARA